jgi:hypothetical protein
MPTVIPVNGAYVAPEIVVVAFAASGVPAELVTGPKIAVPVGAAEGSVGGGKVYTRTEDDAWLGAEFPMVPLATTVTV